MISSVQRIVAVSLAASAVAILSAGCSTLRFPRVPAFGDTAKAAADAKSQTEFGIAFARSAERRGDTDKALTAYERLVDAGQASAEVHHRIALIHDRKGDSAKAEHHYLESLKIDPNQAPVLCDCGYSLYLRESYESAEEKYRNAIEVDPEYVPSRINLGMLLSRTDRFDEALHQFALGGLSEAESHHNIALAAAQDGDTQTATRALHLSREADAGRKSSVNRQFLEQAVYRIANRTAE